MNELAVEVMSLQAFCCPFIARSSGVPEVKSDGANSKTAVPVTANIISTIRKVPAPAIASVPIRKNTMNMLTNMCDLPGSVESKNIAMIPNALIAAAFSACAEPVGFSLCQTPSNITSRMTSPLVIVLSPSLLSTKYIAAPSAVINISGKIKCPDVPLGAPEDPGLAPAPKSLLKSPDSAAAPAASAAIPNAPTTAAPTGGTNMQTSMNMMNSTSITIQTQPGRSHIASAKSMRNITLMETSALTIPISFRLYRYAHYVEFG